MSTTLKADKRDKVGTRHSRKLRDEGRIPATLQAGEDRPHLDISIDEDEFPDRPPAARARVHARRRWSVRDRPGARAGLDVFGERIIHVEFRRVDLHKKTEVEVELDFRGNPKGGLLNQMVTSVTIRAKPQDIPDSIVVNVDGLEPGAHISATDLAMPDGVELAIEPETAIATINEPRAAVEEEPVAEGEEAAEGAEEGAEAPGRGGQRRGRGPERRGVGLRGGLPPARISLRCSARLAGGPLLSERSAARGDPSDGYPASGRSRQPRGRSTSGRRTTSASMSSSEWPCGRG